MDLKRIAIAELRKRRDLAQVEADLMSRAIAQLEGGNHAGQVKRKAGGWPKGKPRGPRKDKAPLQAKAKAPGRPRLPGSGTGQAKAQAGASLLS